MRILLISPIFFIPWADYTTRALRQLEHSVETFPCTDLLVDRLTLRRGRAWAKGIPGFTSWLDGWRRRWHRQRDRRLLERVRHFRPELLLLLHGESFSKESLERVKRRASCPLVCWWVDNPFKHPGIRELLPVYDRLFIFDRSYIAPLKQAGAADVQFLPCAADETVYQPRQLTPAQRKQYGSDIALVAWCYDRRVEVARALMDLDLRIWGRGWRTPQARSLLNGSPRIENRFVPDEEASRIYSAAKIGLNIHADQSRQAGLNTRSFELLASGCFQLTDAVAGMEELLEPGKEVAVYRSAAEAREMALHYLRHPEERAALVARGRARVLRDHTYVQRMRTLLDSIQR